MQLFRTTALLLTLSLEAVAADGRQMRAANHLQAQSATALQRRASMTGRAEPVDATTEGKGGQQPAPAGETTAPAVPAAAPAAVAVQSPMAASPVALSPASAPPAAETKGTTEAEKSSSAAVEEKGLPAETAAEKSKAAEQKSAPVAPPAHRDFKWAHKMDEGKKMHSQGFEGKLVAHNDKETMTADWHQEVNQDASKLCDVCAKTPDNPWCRGKCNGNGIKGIDLFKSAAMTISPFVVAVPAAIVALAIP